MLPRVCESNDIAATGEKHQHVLARARARYEHLRIHGDGGPNSDRPQAAKRLQRHRPDPYRPRPDHRHRYLLAGPSASRTCSRTLWVATLRRKAVASSSGGDSYDTVVLSYSSIVTRQHGGHREANELKQLQRKRPGPPPLLPTSTGWQESFWEPYDSLVGGRARLRLETLRAGIPLQLVGCAENAGQGRSRSLGAGLRG